MRGTQTLRGNSVWVTRKPVKLQRSSPACSLPARLSLFHLDTGGILAGWLASPLRVGPRHGANGGGGNEPRFRPAGEVKNIVYQNRGVFDKYYLLLRSGPGWLCTTFDPVAFGMIQVLVQRSCVLPSTDDTRVRISSEYAASFFIPRAYALAGSSMEQYGR